MQFLIDYQWQLFISLEVLSLLCLLTFLLLRYGRWGQQLAGIFFIGFIFCILIEGLLAFMVYQATGEIGTFQIIIFIFVFYACTIGIADFKKLDRYIKERVGKWRGIDLLTEKDKAMMAHLKNPQVIARKNRHWSIIHTILFIIAQVIFWLNNGNDIHSFTYYLTNLSWFTDEVGADLPYKSELLTQITRLWIIIYLVDFIVAWSYTLFPKAEEK